MAPRADGGCPACGCPVDGSPPAEPRTVELGPPVDAGAEARREEIRHLLLGVALFAGACAGLGLSWILLSGDSFLWKPVVIVAVAMLFRSVWEWYEIDGRLAAALVVCLLASALGLPEGRGPLFFSIAAAAAVYGAHRIRTVVLRRRSAPVPAARARQRD